MPKDPKGESVSHSGPNALAQLNREVRAIRKCTRIMVRADDEWELLKQICRTLCEEAGYPAWVGYAQHDKNKSIRPVACAAVTSESLDVSWADPGPNGQDSPYGKAIRTGETVTIADLDQIRGEAPWLMGASQKGFRSIVSLPLKDEKATTFGALFIYSHTPNAFTAADLEPLEELAADLALSITSLWARATRQQANEALREAQEVFRALVENSPDIIARYDREGARTYVNPTYLNVSQLPQGELIGSAPKQYSPLPAAGATVLQSLLQRVRDSGVAEAVDVWWPKGDGDHWYNIFAFPELSRAGAVAGVMTISRDVTERKRNEAALRESEERYRTIFQNSPLGIFRSTPEGRFIEVNPALAKMLGYDSPEVAVQEAGSIFGSALDESAKPKTKQLNRYRRKGGQEFVANLYVAKVHDADNKPVYLEGIVEDVTENHLLETQLRQAQKMEAVGRLAGGVAHDFNNMLGVILGHVELALEEVSDASSSLLPTLHEIRAAAERSATLTRQLLAFARKQTVAPERLDLNATVKGMISMLRRLIGEDVHLTWVPWSTPCFVEVDPAQIDQILANLCVNARDAIAGVGKITIETQTVIVDAGYGGGDLDAVPGEYVRLTVSDNGCGMDRATQAKLFEPFFTTKEPGKGTGLGLATVYGIVKQNRGFINVYSEVAHGTTVKIYLPAQEERHEKPRAGVTSSVPRGQETILLVEDEPSMLNMTRQVLERLGYCVLPASTPDNAIHIAQAHMGAIHLLITDVVMPEMNGREFSQRLMALLPGLRCLFMSGYTNNVIAPHGVLDEGIHFIAKPFSVRDLATKVREVLEAS